MNHQMTRMSGVALGTLLTASAAIAADTADQLFTPAPNADAVRQIAKALRSGDRETARDLTKVVATPQAVWLQEPTPAGVKLHAKLVVKAAALLHKLPVLVAYNIPFRDCAQFSAGGATTVANYKAWIDALAAGIGKEEALVLLEPDGLGIIPFYNGEWCQPAEADPATAAAERFELLNYAVDKLMALPRVSVYLDGTHTGWLNVGDITDRLVQAGVERATGFFLNASNYQFTSNNVQYGTWISTCVDHVLAGGSSGNCANQYWNGGPEGTKIADLLGPWTGVALTTFGEWSDESDDPALNTSAINARNAGLGTPTKTFVIDTSRNGQGPWDASGYGLSDPQDWCNPPNRGLGLRPTLATGNDLVDGYLWIKIPGESDGECNRGAAVDPVRGYVNPAAGVWFPQGVLELIDHANPAL